MSDRDLQSSRYSVDTARVIQFSQPFPYSKGTIHICYEKLRVFFTRKQNGGRCLWLVECGGSDGGDCEVVMYKRGDMGTGCQHGEESLSHGAGSRRGTPIALKRNSCILFASSGSEDLKLAESD